MKEDNIKKGAVVNGNNDTKIENKQSWLSSFTKFFSVPDDEIKKSREKILREIKGERGDQSFVSNQKIQQSNDKMKTKSFLSTLVSDDDGRESAMLERDVDYMAERAVKKEVAKKVDPINVSFRAHEGDKTVEKVIVDENKIGHVEKNKIVDEFLRRDDKNFYDKVDIAKEKKNFWRLFSPFSANQENNKIETKQPVVPTAVPIKTEAVFPKTVKPIFPDVSKTKMSDKPAVGMIKNETKESVIKLSDNKEHIYIDVPVKGIWRLFSWFTRDKSVKSSDLLKLADVEKEKPAVSKISTVRVEEKLPGHLFVPSVPIVPESIPKIIEKKVEETKVEEKIISSAHIDSPDFNINLGGEEDKKVINEKKVEAPKPDKTKKNIVWFNPEILKSNLIKEDVTIFFDWKKNITVLVSLLFVVIAGIIGVRFTFQYELNQKKADLAEWDRLELRYTGDIKKLEGDMGDVVLFKKRVSLAKTLLDQHIYWTNLFKFLEDNTIDDVYFNGITGDITGKYNLTATAKRYNDIPNMIAVMKENDQVIDASAEGGGSGKFGVGFDVKIVVKPDIFYKKNEK